MTTENKQLLLKDLGARLPYGVKCQFEDSIRVIDGESSPFYDYTLSVHNLDIFMRNNNFHIKPYLRPISSMTKEEIKEHKHLIAFSGSPDGAANLVDWLNKKRFAYSTIDGKDMFKLGVALEAPKDMY